MPLNFAEEEKPKETKIETFFKITAWTRPLSLDGEVIPDLLAKCGDVKARHITMPMVEQYLDKHVLVFDREILKEMFREADYQKHGYLDEHALASAISGRYPKRMMTSEWRQLVALLLNVPHLLIAEDLVYPKKAKNGVFGAESVWDEPPPALPPIHKPKAKKEGKSGEQSPSSGTVYSPNVRPLPDILTKLLNDSIAAASAPPPPPRNLRRGDGAEGTEMMSSGMLAALTAENLAAVEQAHQASRSLTRTGSKVGEVVEGVRGLVRTGSGRVLGHSASLTGGHAPPAEPSSPSKQAPSGSLLHSTGAEGEGAAAKHGEHAGGAGKVVPSSGAGTTDGGSDREPLEAVASNTFGDMRISGYFGNNSTAAQSEADGPSGLSATTEQQQPGLAATSGLGGSGRGTMSLTGNLPKQSLRAWNASLPPTSITMSPATLQTIRQTVRSTAHNKPDFVGSHAPLGTNALDNKKTLGAPMDVSTSLARVEPVRPTYVKYGADYISTGDYAPNCRTMPTGWDLHPAAPASAKVPTKYPWGVME